MPVLEFTLIVDGVDVCSPETEAILDRLAVDARGFLATNAYGDLLGGDAEVAQRLLRYRGSEFFANATFGRTTEQQFVTFRIDEASEDVAAQWAIAMLTYALPGLSVVSVRSGPYGDVRIL